MEGRAVEAWWEALCRLIGTAWVVVTTLVMIMLGGLMIVVLGLGAVLEWVDLNAAGNRYLAARHAVLSLFGAAGQERLADARRPVAIARQVNGLSILTRSNEWPGVIGERWCVVGREDAGADTAPVEVASSVQWGGRALSRKWRDVPEQSAEMLGLTKAALLATAVEHCALH